MEVDAEEDPLNERRQRSTSVVSEMDVVNESGNYHLLGPAAIHYSPGERNTDVQQQRWDLNYHEAAIYLQEGENNDKFTAHPNTHDELPGYLITHSTWFYLLDLFAAMLLMFLALVEQPAVPHLGAAVWVHGTLELFGLLLIGLELGMRLKWLGTRAYLHHTRTMIKTVVLVVMAVEAIVVLARQSQHFRVTRAIRPIFLLDSYYCRGTRRSIRQIIQSLPPILDMFALLLFFMLMFSILGFNLFSDIPNDTYFQTIQQSFLSLFILLTTANFPDVMMPSYKYSRWSAIFFIAYLGIELYFLMNLFLAVVYDSFLKMEKWKLKKLMLHKRVACQHCFRLLASKQNPTKITLRNFCGLMKYYKPKITRRDVYLQFKALNLSKSGFLSLDEFYTFYDITNLKWKARRSSELWFIHFRSPLNTILKALRSCVISRWFDGVVYFVIFANFVWILGDTILISVARSQLDVQQAVIIENEYKYIWVAIMFLTIYIVEIVLKILALGPHGYFNCGWNRFDFLVVMVSAIGLLLELVDSKFYYLLVLRPLRLLRLFKLKRRLRDILGTIVMLFSRMVSIAIVILLMYYSFAIVGIELFSKYDLKDSCINGSVEVYYRYTNGTDTGYYYLNSFENILISCVTLFELTVVNNWYIIMEGYACVSSPWSRIYFMIFYILTMIVMTVVVAFILEAFLFRIQYRDKMYGHDMDDDALFKVDVLLAPDEVFMCHSLAAPLSNVHIQRQSQWNTSQNNRIDGTPSDIVVTWFCGERLRSKDDFNMKMYKDEVEDWIAEEAERHHRESEEQRLQLRHSVNRHSLASDHSRVT